MIKGAKDWNKPRTYYSQVNNPTEEMLRKTKEEGRSGFLESCGPTSAVMCLDALGYDLRIRCPGVWEPQPEEVLTDFFNDHRNYEAFQNIRDNLDPAILPGNRVPQYYPYGVEQVFGARGFFSWGLTWSKLMEKLVTGHTVQLCLKNPGHYIAAVAFDFDTEEVIYNDPWPGRHKDKKGFNKRFGKKYFNENIQGFYIYYEGAN